MKLFDLEIITQEGVVWSGQAESITLPTSVWEIGIMAGHAPLVGAILPGEATIRTDNENKIFVVTNGFFRITNGRVSVLSDSADALDALDEKLAQEARDKAQHLMQEKLTEREFAEAETSLQRSLLQLKVIHRRRSHRDQIIGK